MADDNRNQVAHNAMSPIEQATATLDRWNRQIETLRKQPEFASPGFFDLLVSIIDDAKNGRRREELLNKCQVAADMAENLFEKTKHPAYKEWMLALLEYAETWKEDGNPITFMNPLLQAEIQNLKEEAAERPDPIKKLTAALLSANEAVLNATLNDAESLQRAKDAVNALTVIVMDTKKYLQTFRNTEQAERLKTLLEETSEMLDKITEETSHLMENNIKITLVYLDEEIKKPKYGGMSLKELVDASKDEDGEFIEDSLYLQAIHAAEQAMKEELPASKREAAKNIGALLAIGDRQVTITDRKFQFALKTLPNDYAYIIPLKENILEQGILNKKTGELNIEAVLTADRADIKDIDFSLLTRIFAAAYKSNIQIDSHTITVYFPTFCKEMGINHTGKNAMDIFKQFEKFSSLYGVIGNRSCYKVFDVLGFNSESNTLTFATPYMNQILLQIATAPHRQVKTKAGELKYEKEAYSFLIHSTIVKEKNKTAVEIVDCIIALLFQRGTTPDSRKPSNKYVHYEDDEKRRVTCHISFSTIIDYTPLLHERLEATRDISNRNKILKNAFSKAYKLLKEKTDLYEYYLDLNIPDIVPTCTRLEQVLEITHNGRNKNYKH